MFCQFLNAVGKDTGNIRESAAVGLAGETEGGSRQRDLTGHRSGKDADHQIGRSQLTLASGVLMRLSTRNGAMEKSGIDPGLAEHT